MITLVSFTFLHLDLELSISLEMYPETIPLLKLWAILNTKAVVKQFGPYM